MFFVCKTVQGRSYNLILQLMKKDCLYDMMAINDSEIKYPEVLNKM